MSEIHEQFRAERMALGEQLLTHLRDSLPFGQVIDLGLGRTATLEKVGPSRVYRPPVYAPIDTLELTPDTKIIGHEGWTFRFDFRLTNCDQDHIEVTVQITGGGGFV
jgi:hypothetical protein